MADLRTRLGNLQLENPIIVSSGYATQTESAIKKADRYRPGAIILKTSLMDSEYSRAVKPCGPHRYPYPRKSFAACEDGLMCSGALSQMSLERWAEWLSHKNREIRTPLIASIAGISMEGYVEAARMMERAGAVALEIVLACPAPYLRPFTYSMTSEPKVVEDICRAVKGAVSIPAGAKIAPLSGIAKAARNANVDWITLGGVTLAAPGIDLKKIEPVLPAALCIGGSRVYKYSTFRVMASIAKVAKEVHISAHGGVQSWEDVAEFILYGARSVQAQTLFLMKGFSVIPSLVKGLDSYMDEHGFATIEDMRGAIIPRLVPYDETLASYAETKGKIFARVDEALCNGCGICEDVCAFDAIKVVNGAARASAELCEGCRLCVADCPVQAIVLEDNSSPAVLAGK